MPLKVKMNLTESVKQESSDNKLPSDEIDDTTTIIVIALTHH